MSESLCCFLIFWRNSSKFALRVIRGTWWTVRPLRTSCKLSHPDNSIHESTNCKIVRSYDYIDYRTVVINIYIYTFFALICLAGSDSAWRNTWVRQRQRRRHGLQVWFRAFIICAVQFGSASHLTRLYPQDATRETSAGTSRSECQKTLQVCCRLQARISTAVPSTQTIAESTIQNMVFADMIEISTLS